MNWVFLPLGLNPTYPINDSTLQWIQSKPLFPTALTYPPSVSIWETSTTTTSPPVVFILPSLPPSLGKTWPLHYRDYGPKSCQQRTLPCKHHCIWRILHSISTAKSPFVPTNQITTRLPLLFKTIPTRSQTPVSQPPLTQQRPDNLSTPFCISLTLNQTLYWHSPLSFQRSHVCPHVISLFHRIAKSDACRNV